MSKFIVLILFLAFRISHAAPCSQADETSSAAASDLLIEATSIDVSEARGERQVTTLGKIINPTEACFEEAIIEVTYFDQDGKLVDTTTQELRELVIPPNSAVHYRIISSATKAGSAYASQKAQLTNAERRYPRARNAPPPPDPGLLASLFVSWGPMLLLIGAWVFYMKRYLGNNSSQHKILERQYASIEAQSKSLDRIAAAIESARQ